MKLKKSIQKLSSGDPLRIIAIGDSLTQGWMVSKGYLDFFAEMLKMNYPDCNVTIFNRGIPGDTAQGGLFRLREDVLDCDPDLVFIQFALNDAFTGVPPVQFKNTVKTMVDHIRADTDAEILLLTSVPIMHQDEDFMAENFYSRLIELSREENLPIALVHLHWKKKIAEGTDIRNLVQMDMVHPNVEGYRLMAEAIMGEFTRDN
ncbi:MAG TPA: GDSL-type esterase/lipase family protein [Spirochaetota bacterium]|nr:GDSL-type esterase/lipase family protein [Spirochaetota bacterium]